MLPARISLARSDFEVAALSITHTILLLDGLRIAEQEEGGKALGLCCTAW